MTAPVPEEARPRSAVRAQAPVVAAVAAGGGAGATARYAATLWWPTPAGGFPWTILWVNVLGCALMGVLMVAVTEWRPAHPLVRPLLGTGVLGGFTTFSTYAVDVRGLFEAGRPTPALLCLALTPVTALAAVWAATAATRRALLGRPGAGGTR
ncbi:fluoride efflux transporter FluC [Streptomyces lusitanus]|uniref:Fluoride-specific ion channel FluC n=1 Tax=Streptomyces lusitanus TaxID=68232 RepID=A0ABU3JKA7_9ACTN|nr:CrcB family protein [Streptomyces lusitanus]